MSADMVDVCVYDSTSEAPIQEVSTAFETKSFYVDRNTTIACSGLSADSVDIQFATRKADNSLLWESSGTVLDSTTKMQTGFGPGLFRLKKTGTTDTVTVTLFRSRRK